MKSPIFFPRSHLIAAGVLALFLASLLFASTDRSTGAAPESDRAQAVLTEQPAISETEAAPPPRSAPPGQAHPPKTRNSSSELNVNTEIVRAGDSMARIFQRQSVSPRTLQSLLDSGPLARQLRQIHPGHQLTFVTDANNDLVSLTYSVDPVRKLVFERRDGAFKGREIAREPERILSFRHGTINSSLFLAGRAAGLSEDVTLRLAQIFQWDIDFVLDIRAGDRFAVLFEELYLDGELIGVGQILAAEFTNRGREHRAVRYTNEEGLANFYTPEGRSMRKAFLRAPLEFTRISSNFNPQRLHPIHNRVAPHRGIDYAAPTGTPVMAAGEGKVTVAGRTAANGNYIVLQHGQQIQTKYLHLSRFARGISAGTRVRQGQVIGYVGATGWATAPHLHYEFLVNGVHRNPRTVDLPKAEPVPKREIERFHAHTAPLLAMLDSERYLLQIAQNP
jgi:murein DD-endopeptidase MepM/ murein hydrolase activator NlpD